MNILPHRLLSPPMVFKLSRGEVAQRGVDAPVDVDLIEKSSELTASVIFPGTRSPQRVTFIEGNRQHSRVLGQTVQVPLPDGRWLTGRRADPDCTRTISCNGSGEQQMRPALAGRL